MADDLTIMDMGILGVGFCHVKYISDFGQWGFVILGGVVLIYQGVFY